MSATSTGGRRKAALPQPAKRAKGYDKRDVWGIFTPLAQQYNAINLGQGFPNMPAPAFVKEAACKAINANMNQYAHSKGLLHLRKALAGLYEGHFGRSLDPEGEVMVTQGANQGITLAMQAFVQEGDEVILIEPYFDIYKPTIEIVGGRVVTTALKLDSPFVGQVSSNQWKLDMPDLEGKITRRTKAIMLNNPHNPTGKIFSLEELKGIANLAIKHNLLVFADDVYDMLYYEERPERIANLPGMWERTITFGSGGKMFGVTGWRVGWVIGPQHLLKYMLAIHARTVFTTPTPLQEAIACGVEEAMRGDYFERTRNEYRLRRDKTMQIFTDLGLPVAIPHGSYFFMVETSKIKVDFSSFYKSKEEEEEPRDYAICRWLTRELGVTAIPPSAFYEPENAHLASNTIRICFCKTDETLQAAKERLEKLRQYIK